MNGWRLALTCTALLWSVTASAHLVSARFGELYSGMLHPLLALPHIVPWLALGLLGALAGNKTSRWALGVFPAAVFCGVLAGTFASGISGVGAVNLASFVVLGTLVVADVRLSRAAFLAIAIAFGVVQGYGNAAGELRGAALLLYATGVTLAAYLVVALVTAGAFALARDRSGGGIALRAAGSWIAAIGLVFGGFTLLGAA